MEGHKSLIVRYLFTIKSIYGIFIHSIIWNNFLSCKTVSEVFNPTTNMLSVSLCKYVQCGHLYSKSHYTNRWNSTRKGRTKFPLGNNVSFDFSFSVEERPDFIHAIAANKRAESHNNMHFNPLTPMSDQDRISPYNINTTSTR